MSGLSKYLTKNTQMAKPAKQAHSNFKKTKTHYKTRANCIIRKKGKGRRYIVSSVVEGAPICYAFLEALELFAKKQKAELVLLWTKGVYIKDHFTPEQFARIKPYVATEFRFNTRLLAKDFLLKPSQILPLTGLDKYGYEQESIICAATKQFMVCVPRPVPKIPHTLHSTGTISIPNYSSTRIGSMAKQDNLLGALVIEVPDEKYFFIRQVQWIQGSFVDLGKRYTSTKVTGATCCGMVLGDIHFTEEDVAALKTTYDQIHKLQPKALILHDLCSMQSINHHDKYNYLNKCLVPKEFNTLAKDFAYTKDQVLLLHQKFNKKSRIFVVASNHDDFITKWLNDGEFIKDTVNARFGAKLFLKALDRKNLLEDYIDCPDITFFNRYSSMLIEGWEVAEHGDKGANGARGSIRSYARTHGRTIIGHSHTPGIFEKIIQVGTLSRLQLPYTSGSSSWLHSNCVIYEGGHTQLLTFISNKWHI
jgi:hypothetical protein